MSPPMRSGAAIHVTQSRSRVLAAVEKSLRFWRMDRSGQASWRAQSGRGSFQETFLGRLAKEGWTRRSASEHSLAPQ